MVAAWMPIVLRKSGEHFYSRIITFYNKVSIKNGNGMV
jgi:hypothetical protein